MQKNISTYEDVDTLGRSQVELILKVYGGALTSLEAARKLYEAGSHTDGYSEIEKARKFVVHLYTTLNFADGGEVAANLGRMYVYLLSEFDAIEATKSLQHLDSCITVLTNLRSGWEGIRDAQRSAGAKGTMADPQEHTNSQSIVMSA
jgi:flagellar protein FliS